MKGTIELRALAGRQLVESMARELEGIRPDGAQLSPHFAAPGPKSAPRWGSRFTVAASKDAPLRV